MRTKLINDGPERTFAVVLEKGDEVTACLLAFAKEHKLSAAEFTGLGALSDCVLGFFDWETKDYTKIPIREQVEVLALNDIEHRRTRVGSPKTNGFVERFHGTALEEFFKPTLRARFYDGLEALQADLDAWLVHYNRERPHLGYRNQGRRPWDTIDLFVRQEG